MIELVQGIAEFFATLGDTLQHWRGFLGCVATAIVVLVIVSIVPEPLCWVLGVVVGLAGLRLAWVWDVRSRRRGKAPPAGGW